MEMKLKALPWAVVGVDIVAVEVVLAAVAFSLCCSCNRCWRFECVVVLYRIGRHAEFPLMRTLIL